MKRHMDFTQSTKHTRTNHGNKRRSFLLGRLRRDERASNESSARQIEDAGWCRTVLSHRDIRQNTKSVARGQKNVRTLHTSMGNRKNNVSKIKSQ